MRRAVCLVSFLLCTGLVVVANPSRADLVAAPEAEKPYYPARDQWERRTPAELGMDAGLLDKAIAWAKTQETAVPKDLSDQVRMFGRVLGPMPAERGDINGIVIRKGYIVAEFGDTQRVDPTYSVAKSYLATLLGLALDRGRIRKITDPVT